MNGLELFLLGHKLMTIGQEAMPRSGFQTLPVSARTILVDVFQHPDSSIGEITARTGFPQSLVSSSVARFREHGVMVTEPDPVDRRRTLVRPAAGMRERGQQYADTTAVDGALARALDVEPQEVGEIVATLDSLARRLSEATPS
ncbi:MarR family transcriptional regulator [Sphaerisporangium perillae]|uniref:MarR family transcriptional regulator n=1 Tax=Sphaerisporangium perillae TaxID=2935860 RepID=UPI00200FC3B9|nr:MarR family transcriptional regulator [Sphaerisporangium perillae]